MKEKKKTVIKDVLRAKKPLQMERLFEFVIGFEYAFYKNKLNIQ